MTIGSNLEVLLLTLTNMESSHWTTDSQFATSEAYDYDLYVDRDDPIQLLTPPVRSALVTLLFPQFILWNYPL
jgi:hypothetical protein